MATRSGRTYHQELKRRRMKNKDTMFDDGETPSENGIETDMTIPSTSHKTRRRRSTAEDSTFDLSNVSKTDGEKATDSNWVVSDTSKKVKKRKSIGNTTEDLVEKESENDLNVSNIPPKLKKISGGANDTFDKTEKINTTYEKDADKNRTFDKDTKIIVTSKKGKAKRKHKTSDQNVVASADIVQKDLNDDVAQKKIKKKKRKNLNSDDNVSEEQSNVEANKLEKDNLNNDEVSGKKLRKKKRGDLENGVVNDDDISITQIKQKKCSTENGGVNDDAGDKQMKKKKKKVKNSKKKKQKLSTENIEAENKEGKVLDTTSEKQKNIKDTTIDESHTSFIANDDRKQINSPTPAYKRLHSKKSNVVDTTFEKEKPVNTTYERDNKKDKTYEKDLESDSIASLSMKADEKKSSANTTYEKVEKSNDTFDKDSSTSFDTFKQGAMTRKSSIKDATFDKSNASIQSLTTEDFANEKDVSSSPAIKRKSFRREPHVNNSPTLVKLGGIVKNKNVLPSSLLTRKSLRQNIVDINRQITINNNNSPAKSLGLRNSMRRATIDVTSSPSQTLFNNVVRKVDSKIVENNVSSSPACKKGSVRRETINISSPSIKKDSTIISTRKNLVKENVTVTSSLTKRKSVRLDSIESKDSTPKLDSTFNKTSDISAEPKRKSNRLSDITTDEKLNTTFDKDIVEVKNDSKSSLLTSDNSERDISRISITSDESTENIVNTTPLLIESSMDASAEKISPEKSKNSSNTDLLKDSPKESSKDIPTAQTPLKREGTFTKDGPEAPESPRTPGRRGSSIVPAAGCTPYYVAKSSGKKRMLNVTRSIEKRTSIEAAPRLTRVMFCSPVDNPAGLTTEMKRKVIKSNLKGSNKSFVFDESVSIPRPARKRSYTQNDADDTRVKRSRFTGDMQQSVDRLSRPRTTSATAKLATTPKKFTPLKTKPDSKPVRTRLPNFAALHQKEFDKMESLDECQERKAKRAKQMLTPTGSTNLLERISPKNNTEAPNSTTKQAPKEPEPQRAPPKEPSKSQDKTNTPTKKLPTLESLRPGFTRFGFKLNLDINPFSIPPKVNPVKPNGIAAKAAAMPSLNGATATRRLAAKQMVMREKSFVGKRNVNVNRNENRTIIKGVRTNRRFELQMKLRNID